MMNAQRLGKVTAALSLAMCAGLWAAPALAQAQTSGSDAYSSLPDSLSLTGVIRDFKDRGASGGHPDFELNPSGGFGHFQGMVANELDSDGKPRFATKGFKVNSNWANASGAAMISPKSYINAKAGDRAGSLATSQGGQLTGESDFAKWFRDVPGSNSSKPLAITLKRQAGTNVYTFNDRTDPNFSAKGGFFPINGELFGNYSSTGKNFHFTFELETEFIYEKGMGQIFTFTGDDDVWVFIDGKLVIDLGGLHSKKEQTLDLDRLTWMQDGQGYKLKVFHAERRTNESNFRIETTLKLRSVEPPATGGQWD